MQRRRRRKCHHCGKLYEPDARNAYHQKSCTDPDCRKASKAASQLRWRRSPKGRDYFRGSANVLRVQAWRLAHPGYWRRGRKSASPLQEVSPPKPLGVKEDKPEINAHALQDFSSPEGLLLLGLVANLTGSPLQEHIASTTQRLILLGQQVQGRGPRHESAQACAGPATVAAGAGAVQLGGSPAGPG